MSTTDPSHHMARSHYQWRSLTSNRSPRGLIYRPQTKAWTVRSRCQTRRWCSSKPDPPDLLQSSRRRPAITRLEAHSRPTSHHMDPSDLPGHGNIGDLMLSSWLGTDRFGGKSQRRDATADRFAPWWWWWWLGCRTCFNRLRLRLPAVHCLVSTLMGDHLLVCNHYPSRYVTRPPI